MSLIQKKDDEDKEYIEGVEVIGRGDTPDDLEETKYKVKKGKSAEDISGKTARRAAKNKLDTEPDPFLVGDPGDEDDEERGGSGFFKTSTGKIYIAVLIIAIIASVIVGYVIGDTGAATSSVASVADPNATEGLSAYYFTEDELDNVVATWTYDGEEYSLTAREAIECEYSLESVVEDDGTYPAPSAEDILSRVQNLILLAAAEEEGITVTDDEVADYSDETIGSSDYEEIAEAYSLSEDQAEEIMTQMATIQALYDSIVPEITVDYPEEPTEAEEGDEDTVYEEYGEYIVELLGDEWDSENETWATTDSDYYEALEGEEFTSEGATYNQAYEAYYVAYEAYYEEASAASSAWSEYANALYGSVDLQLYGVYS